MPISDEEKLRLKTESQKRFVEELNKAVREGTLTPMHLPPDPAQPKPEREK